MSKIGLTLLLACIGCSHDPSSTAVRVAVDSTPILDLHDPNPAQQLFEFPTGATRLSNGNIAINDYYAARVLFFGPNGKLLRSVGGHGQGPKEFGGATVFLGQCERDSIFIFVFDKGKVAVLDSAGNVARMQVRDMENGPAPCNSRGQVIHWKFTPGKYTPGKVLTDKDPPISATLSVGEYGNPNHEIGEFESEHGPLRPKIRVAIADREVFVGDGKSSTIDVYSFKGKKLRSIPTGAERRTASAALYDAALDDYVLYLVLRDDRADMKQRFRKWYRQPAQTPAYALFDVDAQNAVWINTSFAGEGETVFRVVSASDGKLLGTVHLPVELRLLEVGEDYLLGYFEDDEGFPHVAMYQVRRS